MDANLSKSSRDPTERCEVFAGGSLSKNAPPSSLSKFVTIPACNDTLLMDYEQFAMILDDQDLVACSPEVVTLDEIRAAPKYEIDTDETIDDILHITKVEETLTHLLQQHDSCVQDEHVNAIISGLPKERVDSLNTPGSSCKYGIRAIHGWSVMRMLYMFGLWIILGLIFFFVWLVKHPGDLQTASVPYLMLLTTFPIIIPVLDLYTE